MSKPSFSASKITVIWFALLVNLASAQAPQIVGFTPGRYSLQNDTTTTITVQFDQNMNAATLDSPNLLIYGSHTGFHNGSYTAGSQTVSFTPATAFEAGETVTVQLTQGILNDSGVPIAASFQWSFFIKTVAGTAKFSLDATYAADNGPHFVGIAELNGGGGLDVAIPHSKDASFRIWLNSGDGSLSRDAKYTVGNSPRSVAIGDFNQDGDLDIAAGNQAANTISIADNDGSGGYTVRAAAIAVGNEPVHVTTGDLNGDGFLDLVVVNTLPDNDISVLINAGNGTFPNRVDYPVQDAPQSAFIADFNNDGAVDIVVANSSSATISLLLNDGTGNFGAANNFTTGNGARVVLGHDFNRDGFLDLATVDRNDNTLSILLNNQSGAFSGKTSFAAGADPFGMSVGDLDGDADPDVVISNRDDNNLQVFLNDGSGNFTSDSTYATGLQPRALALGDLNRDGVLDIAAAAWDSDQLHVFFNGVAPILNNAPEAPSLNAPADLAFINQSVTPIVLNWNVPTDSDGDSLHFLLEISQAADFSTTVLTADSRSDVTGFSPTPKVAQAVTDVSFSVSTTLLDGEYYWRVTAHDGTVFGPASGSRKFTVDSTDPIIDSITLTNPTAGFAPNWYNQNSVATVDMVAQYDEARAQSAVFELGAIGGTQQITGINSGLDQTTQVQITLTGATDGSFPLTVTVFDSAGNSAVSNANIALDGSPPTGTMASSPATSQELTFTVDWTGTGTDGAGSGLSMGYNVQFQIDSGPWVLWLSNFQGMSSSFVGEQGRIYGFEVAAHDNVGNVEAFADLAETITEIDTVTDNTAPAAPLNLEANTSNPSPWQNNPLYTVTWENPQDATGIDRALFKLGAPPTSNFDTTGSVTGITSFLVQATVENGQNFHLWLSDGVGNVDFNNRSVVALRYDATAPTGTQASSPSVSILENFAVSWAGSGMDGSGSGLSGIFDIRVQMNSGPFQDWRTNFQGTSADYPGEHGNSYGFEVVAYDVAGNVEAFSQTAETTTLVDTTAGDVTAPGPPTSLVVNGLNPSAWQTSSTFLVSWQAPADPSGITRALYKLGAAPTANFDTTGSVRQGSATNIGVTQTDGQDFYIWFQDQRGNVDFNNSGSVNLRYDNSPPEIFEMDFVNPSFGLDWFNQANSSIVQIIIEYTEKHASLVTLSSADLDTVINALNVQSGKDVPVSFNVRTGNRPDGFYEIKFVVADSAGSVATDSTILRLDSTPPSGTTVSAPDTSRAETFTISWDGTGSDGQGVGLSGVFDIRVRENNGGWTNLLTSFTETSSQFLGTHGFTYDFEVVAYDNLGNVESFLNLAEATTVVDTGFTDNFAPVVQHTQPNTAAQGSAVTLQIQVQDNSQTIEAKLFFRSGGTLDYSERIMTDAGSNTFETMLSANELTGTGVNYFFRVSDGANVTFVPEDWLTAPLNISVTIVGNDNQGSVNTVAQPGGLDAFSFRMISVPLNLTDKTAASVLEDDLGKYDPSKWRLFQFSTANNEYNEFPSVSGFDPFRALWLIVKDADQVIDSGPGTTVRTNEPFEIVLSQGWNDIGMPFPFPIDAVNVQVIQGNQDDVVGPYTFQGSWLLPDAVPQLKPWQGYSFFSDADGVRIAITPTASLGSLSKRLSAKSDPIDWAIGIEATGDFLSDSSNRLGVAQDASAVRDRHDFLEPPFPGDFLSVRFSHLDWDKLPGSYKTDFRPVFEDGQVWSFEVATSLNNETIHLEFKNLPSLPSQFEALLVDKTNLRQIDIRQNSEYSFFQDEKNETREFALIVGTRDYVATSETLAGLIPKTSSLLPNYPNPFNAGTVISYHVAEAGKVSVRILNILGQQVRTLTEKRLEPGVYKAQWDGRDSRGIEIGTGVYFVRLTSNGFQQTRKILLVR